MQVEKKYWNRKKRHINPERGCNFQAETLYLHPYLQSDHQTNNNTSSDLCDLCHRQSFYQVYLSTKKAAEKLADPENVKNSFHVIN